MKHDLETIRRYVDGELSADEAAGLEAAAAVDGALAMRVARERGLRERVAAVMADAPPVPAGLEAAVRASLAGADSEAGPSDRPRSHVAGRIVRESSRINYFAVAACLGIVVGAVLFGVLAPPMWRGAGGGDGALDPIATVSAAAVAEHETRAQELYKAASTLPLRDGAKVHAALDGVLGQPVPLLDLTAAGYEFVAAGTQQLQPFAAESVHLLYRHRSGVKMASVFINADIASVGLPPGTVVPGCSHSCLISDGELVFVVATCDPADHPTIAALVRDARGIR